MTNIQFFRKSLSDGKKILYAWFEAMHTRVDLLLYSGVSFDNLETIVNIVYEKIIDIEIVANRFNSGSELYRINKHASEQPCNISGELAEMIRECLIFHEKTYGCFDITVNSFNNFRSGIDKINLDIEKKTIAFQHPDIQIDLNGYLKGYALRHVIQILDENSIHDALINMGNSSVMAMGNHPNGKGWSVGLDPALKKDTAGIKLYNECLTTSGNCSEMRRHIINPETGEFVSKKGVVSLVTSDPAIGEILSTAFFVADNFQQKSMLEQFKVKII